jgi:hypothetical protein
MSSLRRRGQSLRHRPEWAGRPVSTLVCEAQPRTLSSGLKRGASRARVSGAERQPERAGSHPSTWCDDARCDCQCRLVDRLRSESLGRLAGIGFFGGLAILCAACAAQRDRSLQRDVLRCMRVNHWIEIDSYRHAQIIQLAAVDDHAQLEPLFWPSQASARRAVPTLAPAGVGWTGRISWLSSIGFTLADEQSVDRCLLEGERAASRVRDSRRRTAMRRTSIRVDPLLKVS